MKNDINENKEINENTEKTERDDFMWNNIFPKVPDGFHNSVLSALDAVGACAVNPTKNNSGINVIDIDIDIEDDNEFIGGIQIRKPGRFSSVRVFATVAAAALIVVIGAGAFNGWDYSGILNGFLKHETTSPATFASDNSPVTSIPESDAVFPSTVGDSSDSSETKSTLEDYADTTPAVFSGTPTESVTTSAQSNKTSATAADVTSAYSATVANSTVTAPPTATTTSRTTPAQTTAGNTTEARTTAARTTAATSRTTATPVNTADTRVTPAVSFTPATSVTTAPPIETVTASSTPPETTAPPISPDVTQTPTTSATSGGVVITYTMSF
jgi:hypothetical protein